MTLLFSLIIWMGLTTFAVGTIWILHDKLEAWSYNRAKRKLNGR